MLVQNSIVSNYFKCHRRFKNVIYPIGLERWKIHQLQLFAGNSLHSMKYQTQPQSTCPSAIISKTWYWPPLCSTIVIAISMRGAKDVGPITIQKLWEKSVSRKEIKKEAKERDLICNLQVVAGGPILYIASKLLQIHYKTSHPEKNWKLLDHALMLIVYRITFISYHED